MLAMLETDRAMVHTAALCATGLAQRAWLDVGDNPGAAALLRAFSVLFLDK